MSVSRVPISTTCSPLSIMVVTRFALMSAGRRTDRRRNLSHPFAGVAQRLRMNIGTIVEAETLKVRIRRGRVLGEVEEYFAIGLEPGDSFIFAGRMLRFEGIREQTLIASPASASEPKVPAYVGGRLPLTTHLADRVRAMLADPQRWRELPNQVQEWLRLQNHRSDLPGADELLVETFRRGGREFLVAYCFEGRNAHQTLGMLLTRRMERMGYATMGFVATDYVIAVWSLNAVDDPDVLFDEDMQATTRSVDG